MTTHHKGSKYLSAGARRTALSIALSVCVAGGVQAQSSVGSLFGQAEPGTTITIVNPQTGTTRSLAVDAAGRFTFTQLPPGTYKVTANGVTRDVNVNVGTGTPVNFAAADAGSLDTVIVVGTGAINPIDVSSVESTTVFTAEQIASLPISSDITSVALLAPGTVKGDGGFGNLASFGGSSVAENGYYINGFDVTNMRNMLSFANVPFQGIEQQQVKTGGYGAEYGRSLGGVISIVTKRGSNEWHFGGSVEWEPEWGREPGKDVAERDPNAPDPLYVYRSDNESNELVYSAYASGPIIKDRLFFFGMVEGRNDTSDIFSDHDSYTTKNTSPQGLVKLDWYLTDNHLLEFTGIENTREVDYVDYEYESGLNVGRHGVKADEHTIKSGGQVGILKYTGYLTDSFTLSAQYGYLSNLIDQRLPEPPNANCPWTYNFGFSTSVVAEYVGCTTATSEAFTPDQAAAPDEDTRKSWRLDAEWQLSNHKLRFGVDHENYLSSHRGETYAGGINWAYYTVPDTAVVAGAPASSGLNGTPGRYVNGQVVARGEMYARSRIRQTSSSTYENINSAVYLEDNWQVTDNFLASLGLRWEKFENRNGDGVAWVESDYEIAPRLGFAWDVLGDSTFKVFGNLGRYYIPVASNSSIRATGSEYTEFNWYYVDGWSDVDGTPLGQGAQIGATQINGSLEAPNPASVASTNLTPMYQDELILGAQVQLNDLWMVGARVTRREVKAGMDDACVRQPFIDWAEDQGFDDFDVSSVPPCFFFNPGEDVSLNLDTNGDGTVELATVPASYFNMPDYRRNYNAIELFWERAGEKLHLQGSYTLSHSRGNIEGYVNSTLEQGDPGLTQDFDHFLFMDGGYGPLPNDREHVIKVFGMYKFNEEWRLGGNFLAQSGRPVNCQGFIDLNHPSVGADAGTLNAYSGSTFYCLDGGTRTLHQRGDMGRTPWLWNFDLSATYVPNWADNRLKFKLDVFNLFNNDKVTEYNEFKEQSRNVIDPNYLNDLNYQSPRSLRFTVRYDY